MKLELEVISSAAQSLTQGEYERAFLLARPYLGNARERFPAYQVMLSALISMKCLQVGLPMDQRTPLKVPSTIFQFWDQPKPPDEVRKFMLGWAEKNPEYACKIYNDEEARCFIESIFGQNVRKQYDRCFHPAMKSDFFRICYAFQNGGIYVDADEACIVPLKDWLPGGFDLVASYSAKSDNLYLHNWFFAINARNNIMERAIISALERLWAWECGTERPYLWDTTGPGNFTRAVVDSIAASTARVPTNQNICLLSEQQLRHYLRAYELPYKATGANWRRA